MRYLITLKPLEPYLFGGDNTFGKLGDEGSYLVSSTLFPQQSALLGMLKKEIMIQSGVLTRKIKGEWVDKQSWQEAKNLVGIEKFDFFAKNKQNFGAIKSISPIFLQKGNHQYIKKVNIENFPYEKGLLKGYSAKKEDEIYDNFVRTDGVDALKENNIFRSVEKIANKKGGKDNSLFKKSSYMLVEGFTFAFYLESDYALQPAIVTLGADRSSFLMDVKKDESRLVHGVKADQIVLLSDTYISLPIKEHCTFAITREVSFRSLTGKKHAVEHHAFTKSKKIYLYEKGSVFIEPSDALKADIQRENLQQIGYNIYLQGEK